MANPTITVENIKAIKAKLGLRDYEFFGRRGEYACRKEALQAAVINQLVKMEDHKLLKEMQNKNITPQIFEEWLEEIPTALETKLNAFYKAQFEKGDFFWDAEKSSVTLADVRIDGKFPFTYVQDLMYASAQRGELCTLPDASNISDITIDDISPFRTAIEDNPEIFDAFMAFQEEKATNENIKKICAEIRALMKNPEYWGRLTQNSGKDVGRSSKVYRSVAELFYEHYIQPHLDKSHDEAIEAFKETWEKLPYEPPMPVVAPVEVEAPLTTETVAADAAPSSKSLTALLCEKTDPLFQTLFVGIDTIEGETIEKVVGQRIRSALDEGFRNPQGVQKLSEPLRNASAEDIRVFFEEFRQEMLDTLQSHVGENANSAGSIRIGDENPSQLINRRFWERAMNYPMVPPLTVVEKRTQQTEAAASMDAANGTPADSATEQTSTATEKMTFAKVVDTKVGWVGVVAAAVLGVLGITLGGQKKEKDGEEGKEQSTGWSGIQIVGGLAIAAAIVASLFKWRNIAQTNAAVRGSSLVPS